MRGGLLVSIAVGSRPAITLPMGAYLPAPKGIDVGVAEPPVVRITPVFQVPELSLYLVLRIEPGEVLTVTTAEFPDTSGPGAVGLFSSRLKGNRG